MNIAQNKEELAIVTVTKQGTVLGRRLRELLPDSHLYVPEKHAQSEGEERPYSGTRDVIADVFRRYRNLVLVMATGIAVRHLAGEIGDKHRDAGVVVIDDYGNFCISLLSGHIGGANWLARRVASLIGAQPVVTTASDVNGTLSLDLLGQEFGWEIEDKAGITPASAALVDGEPTGLFQDAGETGWWPPQLPLPANITVYHSLEPLIAAEPAAAILITDRNLDSEVLKALPRPTIIYRPKSLVLGIGCNRGTGHAVIENAVNQVLSGHGLSEKSLRAITTIDLKKTEAGLEKYAGIKGLPVEYHTRDALRNTKYPSPPSQAADRHVGTPSVAEAAALLSSRAASLLVDKTAIGRAVTVAVARFARENGPHLEKGRLFLVGTGPGDIKQLTFAARDALDRSDVVIGYKTYMELIKPLLGRQRIVATGMGGEVDRAKTAFELARQGNKVSLISGGDGGIYGMSAPVGELLRDNPDLPFELTFIPGVPALAAGAALLGSPISGDFTTISLSDYLVPWEEIRHRLELAAQGNFVIVLYNPQSRKRRRQLAEAREIILRHRAPETPVGIVTNAYRAGQSVAVTTLRELTEHPVGMNTILIIGNNTSFSSDGRMVTPRGYGKKYRLEETT